MEGNIKIVNHGHKLYVKVREVILKGADLTIDQLQRLCSVLGKSHGIAAVILKLNGKYKLVIEAHEYLPSRRITVDNWVISIIPTEEILKLELQNPLQQQTIADLFKRKLIVEAIYKSSLWMLDSPRILYEKTPFFNNRNPDSSAGDIDVYRRYEIADIILEEEGLGMAVDVSTSYITNWSVEDYFTRQKEDRFYKLIARQKDHEGTLIYHGPKGKLKCFFKKYAQNLTLATAPPIEIAGKKYNSPYDYYQKNYPLFEIKENDRVALVSFPSLSGDVYVPAKALFVRVSNEMLDVSLNQIDKILPQNRVLLIKKFWDNLSSEPFGKYYPSVKQKFYNPSSDYSGKIPMLPISFGGGRTLYPPENATKKSYAIHFKNRKTMLDKYGCYYVPPAMHRNLYFIVPTGEKEAMYAQLAKDICIKVKKLTHIDVEANIISYEQYYEALMQLKTEYDPEIAIFIFDDKDSVVYFNIRHELLQWKIKRITIKELKKKYKALCSFQEGNKTNGERTWDAFIDMNAYDIVQQLGCIPFVIAPKLNYHSQLTIDVAANGTHIAFSLFIYKEGMRYPILDNLIKPKTDKKTEGINEVFIEKYVTELLTKYKIIFQKHKIQTMLILRDGKDCFDEFKSLKNTINNLKGKVLNSEFDFHFIEYHKNSQKSIRLWEREDGKVENVLEGAYLLVDKELLVLTPTGSGTLHQGTADPIVLRAKYIKCNLIKAAEDVFWVSQMNHSNPQVAQRLTLPAKRADELLQDRRAQEILRVK